MSPGVAASVPLSLPTASRAVSTDASRQPTQQRHASNSPHAPTTCLLSHRLRMEGAPRRWNPKPPRSTTRPPAQGPRPQLSFVITGLRTVGPAVESCVTG